MIALSFLLFLCTNQSVLGWTLVERGAFWQDFDLDNEPLQLDIEIPSEGKGTVSLCFNDDNSGVNKDRSIVWSIPEYR